MTRIEEINMRLHEISNVCENASGEELDKLIKEEKELSAEREKITKDIEARKSLRDSIANGTTKTKPLEKNNENKSDEARAKKFVETKKMNVDALEARSVLVSGGTLATPTSVEGINDIVGAKCSSIIDMCKVVNCTGMGSNLVAYIAADMSAAGEQTEGSGVSEASPTFGYVTIQPVSVLVMSQISKQAKKQSPLDYEQKVKEQALLGLRKKAASLATTKLLSSSLNSTVTADTVTASGTTTGKIDEKTLRKLVLNYGGDESVSGGAVLFLNKTDLIAFGDVRGTNEKKAVYEIIPDIDNPNTGIIKEGGLSVRYCINSNLTACSGTAQTATAIKTMVYGNPLCLELDLFSDYEINVSEDYAFNALLDTIRGDVEIGADVVAKNGFAVLTIAAAASVG